MLVGWISNPGLVDETRPSSEYQQPGRPTITQLEGVYNHGQHASAASSLVRPSTPSHLPLRPPPHQLCHPLLPAAFTEAAQAATYTAQPHPETTGLIEPWQRPQQPHPQSGLLLGPEMHPTGILPILGAESYHDGTHHPPARRATRKGKKSATATVAAVVEEDAPRKRPRVSSLDEAGDEGEKKRSRGRPRLEPKDETAQERRRTQIRLAQRAYRNRKESTIQTLEQQVEALQRSNEEMGRAFTRLHDFAVAQGVRQRMPEVGRQLRETTRLFARLARTGTEDESGVDDDNDGDDNDSDGNGSVGQHGQRSSSADVSEVVAVRQQPSPPETQPSLYGGFIITHEPDPAALPDLEPSIPDLHGPPAHPDYEVITYPTLDNASFPFGFDTDFSAASLDLPIGAASAPTPPGTDLSGLSPSPYLSLPLPSSYAAQEGTFGRRFQRTALERALVLVNMPSVPQQRFFRVFGFCMLFEPIDAIRDRLLRGLERTNAESLHYWRYPFHHLGGAGTHFDNTASDPSSTTTQRFGNQGTRDVLRPQQGGGGYGMGPFDERVMAARDKLDGNHLPVIGPGEYYDPDEVEIYLHRRGVSIPAMADYVTVEVDQNAFTDGDGAEYGTARAEGWEDAGSAAGSKFGSASSSSASWASDSQTDGPSSQLYSGFPVTPPKRRLTVDVNLLVFELVERTTCLGRTPGLKKADIDAAFMAAAREA